MLERVFEGPVLEVGCGPRKTDPSFLGVDLTPGGDTGRVGNASGRRSEADVAADGARLPFTDNAFATVVARHNLEHYVDLVATLTEWRRVLTPNGRMVVVVPDEERYDGRTVELDPTHHHSFDESFVRGLLTALGWSVVEVGPCIEGWSLLAVAHTST